ncbi:hypothetical protein BTO12_19770 [Vibrio splendidus]|nr:hypothetical protein BTO12_19770 [Vibrio splendidus]
MFRAQSYTGYKTPYLHCHMPYLPNKSSALGFTLIELIVTLVLIAILAVIAAPRFLIDRTLSTKLSVNSV